MALKIASPVPDTAASGAFVASRMPRPTKMEGPEPVTAATSGGPCGTLADCGGAADTCCSAVSMRLHTAVLYSLVVWSKCGHCCKHELYSITKAQTVAAVWGGNAKLAK